ncbi:AsnC family transcriptional regulator, partial [Acinetobacter baumannii]
MADPTQPTTAATARPATRLAPKLDETDRRILRALRRDGRLS